MWNLIGCLLIGISWALINIKQAQTVRLKPANERLIQGILFVIDKVVGAFYIVLINFTPLATANILSNGTTLFLTILQEKRKEILQTRNLLGVFMVTSGVILFFK